MRRLYEAGDARGVAPDHVSKLRDVLARLDVASGPEDMDLPGFRLHPLKGELKSFWAVTVRANWRIVFRFEGRHAADVDDVDYH